MMVCIWGINMNKNGIIEVNQLVIDKNKWKQNDIRLNKN